MRICLGNSAEIPLLQALQVRAGAPFRAAGMHSVADNPPTHEETFREAIAAGLLHVAKQFDQPIGFTLALRRGGDCHLEQMSVDPASQRQGIGSALMRHVLEVARGLGFERVTLSTFKTVAWNGPYYERIGFHYLADSELSPPLVKVREDEAASGIDMNSRAMMAFDFVPHA
jgi:GNAT superfamily N-acetyltransferase